MLQRLLGLQDGVGVGAKWRQHLVGSSWAAAAWQAPSAACLPTIPPPRLSPSTPDLHPHPPVTWRQVSDALLMQHQARGLEAFRHIFGMRPALAAPAVARWVGGSRAVWGHACMQGHSNRTSFALPAPPALPFCNAFPALFCTFPTELPICPPTPPAGCLSC